MRETIPQYPHLTGYRCMYVVVDGASPALGAGFVEAQVASALSRIGEVVGHTTDPDTGHTLLDVACKKSGATMHLLATTETMPMRPGKLLYRMWVLESGQ